VAPPGAANTALAMPLLLVVTDSGVTKAPPPVMMEKVTVSFATGVKLSSRRTCAVTMQLLVVVGSTEGVNEREILFPVPLAGSRGLLYFMIEVTTPEPTVLPPSLIANLNPSSIAIGWINSTINLELSPGMHISTPASRSICPVISVVLK